MCAHFSKGYTVDTPRRLTGRVVCSARIRSLDTVISSENKKETNRRRVYRYDRNVRISGRDVRSRCESFDFETDGPPMETSRRSCNVSLPARSSVIEKVDEFGDRPPVAKRTVSDLNPVTL